ncbi:hypothetical protein IID22_02005 [Patescibacteria group bacterium]|nr:hypothetical protein [Patescibacteria group bacterium]
MVDDEAKESEETPAHSESKESKGKPTPKYIRIFVVLVILVGVTVLLSRAGFVTKKPTTTTTAPATEEVMLVGKDAVAVTDYSAGRTVTVSMVVLSKPGYVVVHMDTDGKPGAVIGNSKYLASGESSNVVVTLSRASTGGEVLYAMLHTDDGDGTYAFPGDDLPTKDEDGNVVLMKFTVGAEDEGAIEEGTGGTRSQF